MLKVRLMGTKNDIKWFGKILQRNSKIEVTEFSDLYPNKGTKKFYRAYAPAETVSLKAKLEVMKAKVAGEDTEKPMPQKVKGKEETL